jgi:hypothetical protein
MISGITIRPDVAPSTPNKTSHKAAAAIATRPAVGRGRFFTPAHQLTPA